MRYARFLDFDFLVTRRLESYSYRFLGAISIQAGFVASFRLIDLFDEA